MRTRFHPGLLLALLLTAAFALACRLTVSGTAVDASRGDDLLDDLLGGGRSFASGLCMNRADLYLHRGLDGVDKTAFTNRWFQRLGETISPGVLEHREGAEGMREVLPWVTLAARVASTNTEYVLTQAFLLRAVGAPQQALAELRRLRASQPGNPELLLEEARIRMALGQWARAEKALESCAARIGPTPSTDLRPLLAETAMWRGLLYERGGSSNAAADCLAGAIRLEPTMYGMLSNRVDALRTGRPPPVPVAEVLARYQRRAANPLCSHDHGHEHGHDDHDEE
jgi:tetratricopeptide (TPR) repeat protein